MGLLLLVPSYCYKRTARERCEVSLQWLDWRYRGKRFGLFNGISIEENPTIPYLTTFEEICAETVEKQKSLLVS